MRGLPAWAPTPRTRPRRCCSCCPPPNPSITTARRLPDGHTLRVWVPACCTGEEAYSLALMLCGLHTSSGQPLDWKIFATDIDSRAIAIARRGRYATEAVRRRVPAEIITRHFTEVPGGYVIAPAIRARMVFAHHDVLSAPPFLNLDLVTCRIAPHHFPDIAAFLAESYRVLKPGGTFALVGPDWKGELPKGIRPIVSPTEVVIGGRRTLMCGSNNYFGLSFHPEVIAAGRAALDGWIMGRISRRDAIADATRAVSVLLQAFARPAA